MNRDRAALILYLVAVVTVTLIHHPGVLGVAFLVVVPLSGKDALCILRRAFLAVVAFNAVVSVGYVALSLWRGDVAWSFLLLLNVRVLLLTFLTVLMGTRVNALRALAFSRTLVYVMTLAYSQVLTFRRLLEDFRMAFISRSPGKTRHVDRYRHAASTASFFIRKSMNETTDITMAMNSRGFFDDSR